MILCRWNGCWFLSTGINRAKDICYARCSIAMPSPKHFLPLPPAGVHVQGTIVGVSEVIFFPRLYYHDLPVQPVSWHPESVDPLIRCTSMPEAGMLDHQYFQEILERSNIDHLGDPLLADGWSRPDKFVYSKVLHVDELEKIEGPVSDGSF